VSRAGSFIGAARAPVGFWGRGCGLVFNPEPNKRTRALLEGRLWVPVEMLLALASIMLSDGIVLGLHFF
jgi:hypothetical protein